VVYAGSLRLKGFWDSYCEYSRVGLRSYFTGCFFDSGNLFVDLVEGYLRFAYAAEVVAKIGFCRLANFIKARSLYYQVAEVV